MSISNRLIEAKKDIVTFLLFLVLTVVFKNDRRVDMKKYGCILFDLDGTLTDPYEGITKSVQRALLYFGCEVSDRRELKKFIGPPLRGSFMRYYSIPEDQVERAVEEYRKYFSVTGLFENEIYDGISELLAELCESGVRVLLATSKPEPFARRITKYFNIDKYFFEQCGSDFEGKHETKAQVVARALSVCGVDRSDVLMVGDRMHDVKGAKENGIDCAGVLWGYGDRAELEEAGADMIFESVSDMRAALLSDNT